MLRDSPEARTTYSARLPRLYLFVYDIVDAAFIMRLFCNTFLTTSKLFIHYKIRFQTSTCQNLISFYVYTRTTATLFTEKYGGRSGLVYMNDNPIYPHINTYTLLSRNFIRREITTNYYLTIISFCF